MTVIEMIVAVVVVLLLLLSLSLLIPNRNPNRVSNAFLGVKRILGTLLLAAVLLFHLLSHYPNRNQALTSFQAAAPKQEKMMVPFQF